MRPDPRLYLEGQPFGTNTIINLDNQQSHYLKNVLRLKIDSGVRIFDNTQGEWQTQIVSISKTIVTLKCIMQRRCPLLMHDVHLYFAPLKPDAMHYLIEKATELNVTHLHPVQTARTILNKFNDGKLNDYITQATEQCERLTKPCLHPLVNFQDFLKLLPTIDHLYMCDERRHNNYLNADTIRFPFSALIGPEGGFTPAEFQQLQQSNNTELITLAPSVLRAETAGITILGQIQRLLAVD